MRPATAALVTPRVGVQERRHDRLVVEIPGMLRLPGASGGRYLGTVLDVSFGGLRISSPVAIPAGTQIEVKCQSVTIEGTVRYARAYEPGFNLGIEAYAVVSAGTRFENDALDLLSLFPENTKRLTRG